MTEFLTSLTDGFGPAVPIAAVVFAFAESALGVGSLIPGEAVILALGTGATGPDESVLLLAAVAFGAMAGDHAGYALGRHRSATIRGSRVVARLGVQHWDRASALVRRHGPIALVISRLLPVVRTLTPAVAGASGLPYRVFAISSALGSLLWAGLWVGLGAAAASLLTQALDHLDGRVPAATIAAATLALALVVVRFDLRRGRRAPAPTSAHTREKQP